ncbi:folate-binding protein YgfZ [Nitrosomonas sp.]|uniref:CAF17-like 4Fe-4S cluster assembly/insertion protein YgfZ n=1 Tax=Nitrosomonas sp. TaxID=42353 RepID=UPI00208B8D68|nr:folate-binding protein [Nitrosomonas sp.]GJL75403.1 MAG: folate-binding protein [Nitrosomonas sp.]
MMQKNWRTFLQNHNAVIENDRVIQFGDDKAELKHAQTGMILTDLSHYGLLCFSGNDTRMFLQSQLSCDVMEVGVDKAQYGSYCTPKGRVLANFTLWQRNEEWMMQLPVSLCAAIQKRLSMFVLRSKVQINDCSEQWIRIGVAGIEACKRIEDVMETSLQTCRQLRVTHAPQASIFCYTPSRLELIVSETYADELWQTLSRNARPVGAACWDWLQIRAGIPVILTPTQEQFLPQMINLDLVGGVSFKKGCYPGQEIVARTQYLGKLKRRMFLANIATNNPVSAGDDLFGIENNDQSCGKIVNAAPAPSGGYDVLAVIQQSSVDAGKIYWKNPCGPVLNIDALPYALDV